MNHGWLKIIVIGIAVFLLLAMAGGALLVAVTASPSV